jgi:hypothetical protein
MVRPEGPKKAGQGRHLLSDQPISHQYPAIECGIAGAGGKGIRTPDLWLAKPPL